MSYQQTIEDIDDELSFGKHQNYTVRALLDNDEEHYLNWLSEQEIVLFSDDILEAINRAMAVR